ncbi:MAG: hypothetical protein FWE82_03640 [Defluviitaleaceae bacterium]|nr:hypothetical protein [Defluviitaleaceae bacterium]
MQLNIGYIGVDQICFTGNKAAEYERGRKELLAHEKKFGFKLTAYPHTIITREEAEEAAAFFIKKGADFILVQNSSFAAGETILPFADTGLPIGLWAVPEPAKTGYLPLNSFCGINMYGSILANYRKHRDVKYKYFFGYASDAEFAERLRLTAAALLAVKRFKKAKVALVGGIAPGFNDLYFDERVIEKLLGTNIQRNHSYEEIKKLAESYTDAQIADYLTESMKPYKKMCAGAKKDMPINARFLKAHEDFASEYGYEGLAISCWPKIQADFGACACHSLAKLNQRGIVAACEGDIPGALGMLLLKYLSGDKVTTLLDLVSYDEADETMQLWHCGPTAECFADEDGIMLSTIHEHTNKEGTETRDLRYVHDMNIKPGAATVACFCKDFSEMFIASGVFCANKKERFHGSAGWLGEMTVNRKPIGAKDMISTIMSRGIQHHFPVILGDYTKELMEFAAWLGLPGIENVSYEDYKK